MKSYLNLPKLPVSGRQVRSSFAQTSKKIVPKTSRVRSSISFVSKTEKEAIQRFIEKIDQLQIHIQKVIDDNQDTPQVKSLEAILKKVKGTIPAFITGALKFYDDCEKILDTVHRNQALSSEFVHEALNAFIPPWYSLCELIDKYADIKPPPHASEIQRKFSMITSSIKMLSRSASKSKVSETTVCNCIDSMICLCDNLQNSIYELFSQPGFPNFETNLCKSYKNNIKTFLSVVNNAFSNELLQSGFMLNFLMKVKSGIYSDCSTILTVLDAAFAFPNEMKEIQKLKNEIVYYIDPIIDTLSQQFSIIKPSKFVEIPPILGPSPSASPRNSKKTYNVFDTKTIDQNEVINRIDGFLNHMMPKLMPGFGLSTDLMVNLDNFEKHLSSQVKELETIKEKALKTQKDYYESISDLRLEKSLMHSKQRYLEDQVKQLTEDLKSSRGTIRSLHEQISSQETDIKKLEETIQSLESRGDPLPLREALHWVLTKLSGKEHDLETDNTLIDAVKNTVDNPPPCKSCAYLSSEIDRIQNIIIDVIGQCQDPVNVMIKAFHDQTNKIAKLIEEQEHIKESSTRVYKKFLDEDPKSENVVEIVDELLDEVEKHRRRRPLGESSPLMKNSNVPKRYTSAMLDLLKYTCKLFDDDVDEGKKDGLTYDDPEVVFFEVVSVMKTMLANQKKKFLTRISKLNDEEAENSIIKNKYEQLIKKVSDRFSIDEKSSDIVEGAYEEAKKWIIPFEEKLKESTEEKERVLKLLTSVCARMQGVCDSGRKQVQEADFDKQIEKVHELLDNVHDKVDFLKAQVEDAENRYENLRKQMLDIRYSLLKYNNEVSEISEDQTTDSGLIADIERIVNTIVDKK